MKPKVYGTYSLSKAKRRWWLGIWRQVYYSYLTDILDPLTYRDARGRLYRPNQRFEHTDGGSIPVVLTWLPGFGRMDWDAYFFHDSGYQDGGLYVSDDNGETWRFLPMTQRQVDDLLYDTLRAEGLDSCRAGAIWSQVRTWGWVIWRKYRLLRKKGIHNPYRNLDYVPVEDDTAQVHAL